MGVEVGASFADCILPLLCYARGCERSFWLDWVDEVLTSSKAEFKERSNEVMLSVAGCLTGEVRRASRGDFGFGRLRSDRLGRR